MVETGATIEQEIAQLEKQLQEKKAGLGQQTEQNESLPDKEALRQVVGQKIQQQAPQYVPKPAPQTQTQTDDDVSYLADELKEKVQDLINLVFQNSLSQGIKEAAKSDNPALIDAFHDVLVDQLYDTLVARQKLSVPK